MAQNNFANALATLATLTDDERFMLTQALIAMGTRTQASAPTPTPVKERKALDPAADVDVAITSVKVPRGKVAFTLGYGAGRAGAKLQIKAAGFAWDASLADDTRKGAWVGTTAQAKKAGIDVKGKCVHVTAEFVQAGRDKAAAKQARRERKSA